MILDEIVLTDTYEKETNAVDLLKQVKEVAKMDGNSDALDNAINILESNKDRLNAYINNETYNQIRYLEQDAAMIVSNYSKQCAEKAPDPDDYYVREVGNTINTYNDKKPTWIPKEMNRLDVHITGDIEKDTTALNEYAGKACKEYHVSYRDDSRLSEYEQDRAEQKVSLIGHILSQLNKE